MCRGPGRNFRPNMNLPHQRNQLDFYGNVNHEGSFSYERNNAATFQKTIRDAVLTNRE